MMPEIETYRTTVVTGLRHQRTHTTFYFFRESTEDHGPYLNAKDINAQLFAGLGWLFEFTGIVSELASVLRVKTRRILPPNAAAFIDVVPPGLIVGRLEGRVDTWFDSAWLQFVSNEATDTKNGIRVGPMPVGHITPPSYSFVFRARCASFVAAHAADQITPMPALIRGQNFSPPNFVRDIAFGQLGPPLSRQLTRRGRS